MSRAPAPMRPVVPFRDGPDALCVGCGVRRVEHPTRQFCRRCKSGHRRARRARRYDVTAGLRTATVGLIEHAYRMTGGGR